MERTPKTVKGRNLIIISILYLLSGTIVRGGTGEAHRDVWLSMLINLAVFTAVTFLYCQVCKRHPNRDLFSMFYEAFSKSSALCLSLIYIAYGILIGSMSWGNFAHFTSLNILPDKPAYLSLLFLALVCVYGAKKGIYAVTKYASFIFPFVIFILAVTVGLSVRHMDFFELLPIYYDADSFWNETLTLTAFPFGDTVLLFVAYEALDRDEIRPTGFMSGVWFAFLILSLIMVRNVAVLGAPVLSQLRYATYHAMGVVGVEDFFKRIEILLVFAVIFCDVIKGVIALLFVSEGISKVFGVKKRETLIIPAAVFVAGLSLTAFDSNESADTVLGILRYFSLPIQVLGPGLIFLKGKLRKNRSKEVVK